MPAKISRKTRAEERASETLQRVINSEVPDTPMGPAETSEKTTNAGSSDEERMPKAQEQTEVVTSEEKPAENIEPTSLKRAPGEDFYDYLARIPHDDWASGKTSGLYILKENPAGKGNIQLDRIHQAITHDQFVNQIAPKYGPGNYVLQFQTAAKTLTACSHRVTYDGPMVGSAGGSSGGSIGGSLSIDAAIAKSIDKTGEMLQYGAKAAVDVSKHNQIEQSKGLDVGSLLTGLAALIPKPTAEKEDKITALIMAMLENQRKDAERRADEAIKNAAEQRKIDLAEAERRDKLWQAEQDRRERDRKEELDRREREYKDRREDERRYWDAMNKEKDKKDEFGLGGVLRDLVVPLVKERFEGGAAPEGWSGVAANFADKIPDIVQGVSAMMAARNGQPLPMQPIQQHQQLQETQQPRRKSPQEKFHELLVRIGEYLERDQQLWDHQHFSGIPEDADNDPLAGVIEVEYPSIFQEVFVSMPKQTILETITNFPIGKWLLENEFASPFLHKIIDSIKQQMVNPIEPEENPVVEVPKPNGKHKKVAQAV